MFTGMKRTTRNPDETAAQRLAAIVAEIAELEQPMPTPADVDVDIDALTATIVDRNARHQALSSIIPALERAVLSERAIEIRSELAVREKASVKATAAAHAAQEREQALIAERVEAVAAATAAQGEFEWWSRELDAVTEALRVHDERHPQAVPA